MSIISELMECIETATWCYEDGMGSRRILHIPYEQLTAIAKRIRKASNDAVNKAHADGERNALKQVRSRSEDYRKGYETGYAKAKEECMENAEGASRFEQGSSITDELRKWVDGLRDVASRLDYGHLYGIADRIDEQAAKMYADLTIGMEPMDEEHMAEEGWVKLPLDADGVPIHVGDELTNYSDLPAKVRCMVLGKDGWLVCTRMPEPCGIPPTVLTHVRPDSWERIIGDAMGAFLSDDSPAEPTMEELVERCRKLAGE